MRKCLISQDEDIRKYQVANPICLTKRTDRSLFRRNYMKSKEIPKLN